jgi:membrane-bound inhibitor of C-type lysozyme
VLIRGELASRERIVLTAESVAIVELTRTEDGRVIAEQRLPLADRQVPVPFELRAHRAAFEGTAIYLVRGAIALNGRTRWLSDPVEVRAQSDLINVGTLILKPYEPVAFSSPLVCGDRTASVGVGRSGQREFLQLTVEGERFELYETITGSGSRYEAVNDARTFVWFKGQRATLTLRGVTYPECMVAK